MKLKLISLLLLLLVYSTSAQGQSLDQTLDSIQQLRKLLIEVSLSNTERLVYTKRASDLSHKTGVDSIILLSDHILADTYYYYLGDYKNLNIWASRNLKLAEKLKDSLMIGYAYQYLGSYYDDYKNQKDSAYFYYYKALKIYEKFNDQKKIHLLTDIGLLQENEMDLISAERNYIKAIEYSQSFPDSKNKFISLWVTYNALGVNLKKQKQYDKALDYYQKAIETNNKLTDNYTGNLFIKINIAELYKEQKKFKKSIAIYLQLLKDPSIYKKDPITYAAILNNLAYTRFLSNDSNQQELITLFNRAYNISDSLNYHYEIAAIGNDMSEFYISINQRDTAVDYLEHSYNIAKESEINSEVLRSLKLLSEAKEGEAGKTYLYQYISLSDSILAEERSMRNKFARIQFETDEITAKNEVLTKDRKLLFITIIALFMSLMLLYFNFRQRNKNKALLFESEQQKANENIYTLMLDQQSKLERSRIEERFRISEDLHDGVLGKLFGIRTGFGYLGTQISGETEILKKYDDHIKHLQAVEKEIRNVSHNLKDDILSSKTNFETIIDYYIKALSELHAFSYNIQSESSIPWNTIDDSLKVNLYRVVQESVLNTIKHAEADNIEVKFSLTENRLHMSIKDDGIGFDIKQQHKGIGLKNMQSRAKKLKGKIRIHSVLDHGTTITVMMPV